MAAPRRPGLVAGPALVIWEKQDAVLPVTHAYIATERLPDAELHVFDRCGHMSMFECAQEFNRLVRQFLAGWPGEAGLSVLKDGSGGGGYAAQG